MSTIRSYFGVVILAVSMVTTLDSAKGETRAVGSRVFTEEHRRLCEVLLNKGTEQYLLGDNLEISERFLRGALRIAEEWTRQGGEGEAVSFARQVCLQARLFLGNLRVLEGSDVKARATYASAMAYRPAGVSTTANICGENLAALKRRGSRQRDKNRDTRRFLVFRFWAGLSNRRQELIGMIGAAKLLNRTLVLPDLVEGRWMANHAHDRARQPVSDFYDINILNQYVSTITEAEFTAIAAQLPLLSAELHIRDHAYPGQMAHLGLSYGRISTVRPDMVQQWRTPEELLQDLQHSPSQILVVDFSYRLLFLGVHGEFEFFNGTYEWTPRTVGVTFQPAPLLVDILSALHFSATIRQHAQRVLAEMGGGAFVAVHLRRNDMANWKNRQHAWAEKEDVLQQTQALQRSSGIASVFLLTDADEHEKSFFSTHIPQLHIANAADSGLSEAMIAVVDQAVAAEATRFLGNFWSTFSWAIIEERSKRGFPPSSSSFIQAPFSDRPPNPPPS